MLLNRLPNLIYKRIFKKLKNMTSLINENILIKMLDVSQYSKNLREILSSMQYYHIE
jgi:hypothetical protein